MKAKYYKKRIKFVVMNIQVIIILIFFGAAILLCLQACLQEFIREKKVCGAIVSVGLIFRASNPKKRGNRFKLLFIWTIVLQ